MSAKFEIDPDLSRTAVRYHTNDRGWTPWCWNIVQVNADGAEKTIGTHTIDELQTELTEIQGEGEIPEPDETGDLPIWEQIVERAWLQHIADAAEKCSGTAKLTMPLLRPTEDDRSAAKRQLATLLDATDGYTTWCRD